MVLSALGMRGGAAIFWNKEVVSIDSHSIGRFTIMIKVTELRSNVQYWLTTAYGPIEAAIREEFFLEMANIAPPAGEPWLIT